MNRTPITDHHSLWQSVGENLVRELEQFLRSQYLDSEMKGRGAEAKFREWLQMWLPGRVTVVDGVVVDRSSNPTTQRDVILFDSFQSPMFRDGSSPETSRRILPIEGVLGAVEVNASTPGVEKILKDIDKVAAIKRLVPQDPPARIRSLTPVNGKLNVLYHEHGTRLTSLGYVFAIDCDVSLRTLAEHVAAHNHRLGIDASIDGIFILRKGYILHCTDEGWVTGRHSGSTLAYMDAEQWDVLLMLVSQINHHLRLGAAGWPPSIEEYFAPVGSSRRTEMLARRMLVSDESYRTEQSPRFQAMP